MTWDELIQFVLELRLDHAYLAVDPDDYQLRVICEMYSVIISEGERLIKQTNYYTDI